MDNIERRVAWSTFPVEASPRPLILLSSRVTVHGFADGDAKIAWYQGAVEVTADVPAAVTDAIRAAVTGTDSSRTVSAASVVLDQATRVAHPFDTDRGPVTLPGWRLDGPALLEGGCVVLDPDVRPWWQIDDHPDTFGRVLQPAIVDVAGTGVQWPATGGVLTEFIGVEFEEARTFVVGRQVTRERQPEPGTVVPLPLIGQLVSGTLKRPLGARVLLTHSGSPFAAIDDSQRADIAPRRPPAEPSTHLGPLPACD